jgi:hypothetical protein
VDGQNVDANYSRGKMITKFDVGQHVSFRYGAADISGTISHIEIGRNSDIQYSIDWDEPFLAGSVRATTMRIPEEDVYC